MRQSLINYVSGIPLKWKAIAFVSLMVMAVGCSLSAYFLHRSDSDLTAGFQDKCTADSEALANNSRGPILFEDPEQFDKLLSDLLERDANVIYAVITDVAGAVLAEKPRETGETALPQSALKLAMEHAAAMAPKVEVTSLNYHVVEDRRVLHMATPVYDRQGDEQKIRVGSVHIIYSVERTRATIRRAFLAGAGLTLIIVAIGIIVAVLSCDWALTPAVEIARAARKMGEGDLSQRVPVRSRDEIGVLASTFNHMAESLDEMTRGLEDKVRQRTEDLHREQDKLKEVNLQLERATRHKSEFVANMSHELRTPLNAVIGFSEVLLEKMFGPINEKQEEYLNDILSSGRHLLSLINDILDLAKIEAGKMELEPNVFNLRQVLEGSLIMVKERALNHGIALSAEIGGGIGAVCADERKIKQVIFNLLSNAVKFTPDKGAVKIKAAVVGEEIQVAVSDTGVGIPQNEQGKIFEEFHQVDSGLTAKAEGTGLGLTLCKKFIELHGGRIWVESTPDRGSTFTFALPRQKVEAPAAPPAALLAEPLRPLAAAPAPAGSVQVLIIEDDPSAADIFSVHLKEAGYTVEVARDGVEGWEKLKQLSPRAVLLDVLLPRMNGWAFLAQMKGDPTTKDVPVIMVSILDQKGKGLSLGATDFLVKPIDKEALFAKLNLLGLHPQNASVKILAIDDDPRTLELLAASLEPAGFEVLKASSGEQGVEIATTQRPNLIILDLLMPGMNGFEVIEKLEQSHLTQQMPIILFTVKHLSAEEKERLKGRVAGVAEKDAFNKEAFVGIVGKVLQRST